MCGINGIYHQGKVGEAPERIVRMNDALAQRGPDDEGVYNTEAISLGHRRLAIIDLSSAAHQPMPDANDRYQVVFNGEIYNFRALRNELKDYHFKGNSDTEVLLAAFVKWGINCVQHFNGMFAFAIYDSLENRLWLARDPMGIKPLYYTRTENAFVFSSSIRAIIASGLIPPKLNENVLADYLRYQTVLGEDTILREVHMMPSGHHAEIHLSEFKLRKYWSFPKGIAGNEHDSYESICRQVRELLARSVERRLVSDVNFGAFLSGGIDSTIVVGLMSQVMDVAPDTFNICFSDPTFSESRYARQVAGRFHTNHHEFSLHPDDFRDLLPAALEAMDHPGGDGPNTWIVSKLTREAGVKMALSGLGGDELFAGYDVFKRAYRLSKSTLGALPMRKIIGALTGKIKKDVRGQKLAALFKLDTVEFRSYYPLIRQALMDDTIEQLLDSGIPKETNMAGLLEGIGEGLYDEDHRISEISTAEMICYLQPVLLRDTDQMSMDHALEVRVPFLDKDLVSFVLSLKDEAKSPLHPKKLLIDAMADILPGEIWQRPKMGFTLPWAQWMKHELRSFCEVRIIEMSQRPQFNGPQLMTLWQRFLKGDPQITWSRLWMLVVLSDWFQNNGIE